MKPQEFKDLLDKFERGECNEQEIKFINRWYNTISSDDAVELEPVEIEARLWSSINPEIQHQTTSFPFWLKVAATFFLLLVAGLGSYSLMRKDTLKEQFASIQNNTILSTNDFITVANNDRAVKEIFLDDGSQIILKVNSKVRYASRFNGPTREVYLDGEAFFKVKRDTQHPFIVYSKEVVTKVLGTSFNVKAYENDKEITVAVKTGKVSVSANTGSQSRNVGDEQTVIITPNQKVVYNRQDESVSKRLVEKPEVILPVPTLFKMQYDGAPVTKIFEVLEQNYGIDIQFDEENLKNCVLTTSMSDEGLHERIQVICKAINAEYFQTEGIIVIKGGNNCK